MPAVAEAPGALEGALLLICLTPRSVKSERQDEAPLRSFRSNRRGTSCYSGGVPQVGKMASGFGIGSLGELKGAGVPEAALVASAARKGDDIQAEYAPVSTATWPVLAAVDRAEGAERHACERAIGIFG